MTTILRGLSQGYTIHQILDWLIKNDQKIGKKVKEALRQGHDPDQIGAFLTKGKSLSYGQQQQMLSGMTEREKAEKIANYQPPSQKKVIENLPYLAASAVPIGMAAYRLSQAGRAIVPQVLPALQQQRQLPGPQGQRGLPAPGPQAPTQPRQSPQTQAPSSFGPSQSPQGNVASQVQAAPPMGQATPQTPGPFTPPRQPNPKHGELIKKMGIEGVIQGLANKEDPTTIANVLEQHILRPGQKKWLSEQTQEPLENIVSDYLASQPQKTATTQEQTPEMSMPSAEEAAPQEQTTEPRKQKELARGDSVQLPNGKQGKIKDIAKKVATVVREDGKSGQYRVQDLKKLTEAKPKAKEYASAYYQLPGESDEEWKKRKLIASSSKKAAKEIMTGKTFLDLPMAKEIVGEVGSFSVAEDVLGFLAGQTNAYEPFLSEDEKKQMKEGLGERDIYGAQMTPNMVWNMLLNVEPKLHGKEIRPKSVKGRDTIKGGKMGSEEFRRSLTHKVYGIISGKNITTELADKIKKISTARSLSEHFIEAFKHGKIAKVSAEMEKLANDEYFNSLFTDEIEQMVRKMR